VTAQEGLEVRLARGAAATQEIGANLALALSPGAVIGLCGPLGAGKTVMVRGAVQALGGDPRTVRSPTFTLLNIYPCSPRVYHFDLYRLHSSDDLEGIGFFEFTHADGITFIEWADRFPEVEQLLTVRVDIAFAGEEDTREVSLKWLPAGGREA